jgi:hypothetical protein
MGQNPRLFVKGEVRPLTEDAPSRPRPIRPRRTFQPVGHRLPGRRTVAGKFPECRPITDAVNLGTVALRAGKKVLFDSAGMRITNAPEANRFLVRDYRPGWEL